MATGALKATIGFLLVPIGWALVLRTYSVLASPLGGSDVSLIELSVEDGFFVESLVRPLLGITVLLLLFAVMRQIFRWANIAPGGARPLNAAWSAATAIGYVGFRAISGAARGTKDAVSGATSRHRQEQRWAQQEARSARQDARAAAMDQQRAQDRASQAARQTTQDSERSWSQKEAADRQAAQDRARTHQQSDQAWQQRAREQTAEARRESDALDGGGAYDRWAEQEDHRDRVAMESYGSGGMPAAQSAAASGDGAIGKAERAYSSLRPEHQAAVTDLVHGGGSDADVSRGLAAMGKSQGLEPMEQRAFDQLSRVGGDELAIGVPGIALPSQQAGAGAPMPTESGGGD